MDSRFQKMAALYLIVQGLAALIWWTILFLIPDSRALFVPQGVQAITLLGFWLADFIFFVLGSLYCGFCLLINQKVNIKIFWCVVGGISYAALYCIGLSVLTRGGWLSSILMLMAANITIYIMLRIDE